MEEKRENKDLVLDIQDLDIRYETDDGVCRAVNGVSLQLERGKTVGLVGETGAGKTTIALGIMGLIPNPPGRVAGGSIRFFGEDAQSTVHMEECAELIQAIRQPRSAIRMPSRMAFPVPTRLPKLKIT